MVDEDKTNKKLFSYLKWEDKFRTHSFSEVSYFASLPPVPISNIAFLPLSSTASKCLQVSSTAQMGNGDGLGWGALG